MNTAVLGSGVLTAFFYNQLAPHLGMEQMPPEVAGSAGAAAMYIIQYFAKWMP